MDREIREITKELETLIEQAEKNFLLAQAKLESLPKGTLICRPINGYSRYYLKENDNEECYLDKSQEPLMLDLAQKKYTLETLKNLDIQLKALRQAHKILAKLKLKDPILSLPKDLRDKIIPEEFTDHGFVYKWQAQKFKRKPVPEDLPFYTKKGEHVRSKSEVLIADRLNAASIPYHYEKPIVLKQLGKVHPDFTVLNPWTGKEYYWEHFGKMSDPEYANCFVKRVESYILSDFLPGEKLLMTFEDSDNPLDMRNVDLIIDRFLL